MADIIRKNAEFCEKKGMKPILKDTLGTDDCRKETLSQLINVLELIFKKFNNYDAVLLSQIFRHMINKAFWRLYGMKWEKMSDCSELK